MVNAYKLLSQNVFLYLNLERFKFSKDIFVILASDLRRGTKILWNNAPYTVLEFQHVKPGKGGAFMRTKMKNMITGLVHEETFRSEEKFSQPDLQYRTMQFLYAEDTLYHFMDQENFEEVALSRDQVSEVLDYLKEQALYTVLYFNDGPIAVTPPIHMELTVVEAPPGVRGDTAQGAATKPGKLETGMTLQIPLFVGEGDVIKVDTRDGVYVERVNKK